MPMPICSTSNSPCWRTRGIEQQPWPGNQHHHHRKHPLLLLHVLRLNNNSTRKLNLLLSSHPRKPMNCMIAFSLLLAYIVLSPILPFPLHFSLSPSLKAVSLSFFLCVVAVVLALLLSSTLSSSPLRVRMELSAPSMLPRAAFISPSDPELHACMIFGFQALLFLCLCSTPASSLSFHLVVSVCLCVVPLSFFFLSVLPAPQLFEVSAV